MFGFMWRNLDIIHFPYPRNFPAGKSEQYTRKLSETFPDYFLWRTCLRHVIVSDTSLLSQLERSQYVLLGGERYCGYDAYLFLLEVCFRFAFRCDW